MSQKPARRQSLVYPREHLGLLRLRRGPGLLERAGDEQLAAYLRRSLDRLKPRHRDVLTRVYLQGESIETLSTAMDLNADAVAALLYRARGALSRLMERDAELASVEAASGGGVGVPVIPLLKAVRKC